MLLQLFVTFIFIFENEQKLPIRTAHHIFLECRPTFCCPLFFLKLSQPLGQNQQNSKQTYCRLSIIIFLWTPKGFISPESFLNFLLNLYISSELGKSFKFMVLRLLQIHFWVKKSNLFNFTHAPKRNSPPGFYHYPQEQTGGVHRTRTAFSYDQKKIFFPEQR